MGPNPLRGVKAEETFSIVFLYFGRAWSSLPGEVFPLVRCAGLSSRWLLLLCSAGSGASFGRCPEVCEILVP